METKTQNPVSVSYFLSEPYVLFSAIQPEGYERPVRLWWDDTLPGFVRRLSWSPDGLFLAAPSAELNPPNSRMKVDVDVTKDTVDLTSENEEVKENMNPQSSVIQVMHIMFLYSV